MAGEREDGEEIGRPSKSQLKREMLERQALGEALAALPEERLDALPLPDTLRAAIGEYRRTPTHGGRRRQMQYIGKLMRGVDEMEPLRAAVEAAQRGRAEDSQALHEAEHWRTRLLASDEALTAWVEQYPAGDLQQLRVLLRAARAAAPAGDNRRALRQLFRFLRAQRSGGA